MSVWRLIAHGLLAALLPVTSAVGDAASYDAGLCVLAERMLLNADGPVDPPFAISVLRGTGNGFHTIQMDVDAPTRTVVVAMSTGSVEADGGALTTHVACKLVDRDRVNDVLGLALAGPARSCRDVNEHTYGQALAGLSPDERRRYESGRRLRFGDDYVVATGAEWLPMAVEKGIRVVEGGEDDPGYLEIRAPAVVVPWNAQERNFFQGTHHCKLVSLSVLQRWMRGGATSRAAELFPSGAEACAAPSSLTSVAGSCEFWFAPAGARYCQDYSGPQWTLDTARAECGKRHASPEALREASNRYAGAGGVFSESGCAQRPDRPKLAGTCVFHCRQPDETLWHPMQPVAAGPASAAMMSRACDLFVP